MKEAVAYIRVSLEEENPENQEIAIRKYAEENGFVIKGFFKDIGVSGAEPALERERFGEMLNFAKDNNINTILLYDLSRLGRDFDDVLATARYLVENNFNLFFANQPELNVNDLSIRKLIFSIIAWAIDFERTQIIKRTKAGLERARKEGKKLGRPRKEVSIKKIQSYLEKGIHMTDIARLEGVSYSTIRRRIAELKV
jgi:DNA invertase Pin-like site-specific DNA recombinase